MWKMFKQDVRRWIVPQQVSPPEFVTLRTTLRLLLWHMGLRAMFWYRFGEWCVQKRIPLANGIIMRKIFKTYGLDISPGDNIEGGLYIAHPVGCVIKPKKIGKNCTIIASVTIGMRNEWAFPRIGDNVFIGAGARILGDITIGDGAVIGANAVVIKDVPAGATVVGIPARVVRIFGKPVGGENKIIKEEFEPASEF
jgi:serine O-acetyltransferase